VTTAMRRVFVALRVGEAACHSDHRVSGDNVAFAYSHTGGSWYDCSSSPDLDQSIWLR